MGGPTPRVDALADEVCRLDRVLHDASGSPRLPHWQQPGSSVAIELQARNFGTRPYALVVLDEVPFRVFHFIYGLQALPVRW